MYARSSLSFDGTNRIRQQRRTKAFAQRLHSRIALERLARRIELRQRCALILAYRRYRIACERLELKTLLLALGFAGLALLRHRPKRQHAQERHFKTGARIGRQRKITPPENRGLVEE